MWTASYSAVITTRCNSHTLVVPSFSPLGVASPTIISFTVGGISSALSVEHKRRAEGFVPSRWIDGRSHARYRALPRVQTGVLSFSNIPSTPNTTQAMSAAADGNTITVKDRCFSTGMVVSASPVLSEAERVTSGRCSYTYPSYLCDGNRQE